MLAIHGTFAALPLVATLGAWVLISMLRALHVPTGASCAVLWAYAAALLAANAYLEGGGFQFLAHALLGAGHGGAGARLLAGGAALDAVTGLSPPFFTPALIFRYTLLRLLSWGLDLLTGRLESACRLAAAAAAASAAVDEDEEGGSPTISAVQAGRTGTGGRTAFKPRALSGEALPLYRSIRYLMPSNLRALLPLLASDAVLASPVRAKLAPTAATAVAASLPALLSYVFFPPLFLCGPVLTAADYMSQQQQVGTKNAEFRVGCCSAAQIPMRISRSATTCFTSATTTDMQASGPAAMPSNWRRSLLGLTLWAAALEVAGRTLLADGALLSALAARPWLAFPLSVVVLQALFLQSVVPWAVARLGAGALGLRAPDEAPASWVASSASVRAFWRAFHVSWHCWLKLYVYLPFGGGTQATLAVLALSTALHGAHGRVLFLGRGATS